MKVQGVLMVEDIPVGLSYIMLQKVQITGIFFNCGEGRCTVWVRHFFKVKTQEPHMRL